MHPPNSFYLWISGGAEHPIDLPIEKPGKGCLNKVISLIMPEGLTYKTLTGLVNIFDANLLNPRRHPTEMDYIGGWSGLLLQIVILTMSRAHSVAFYRQYHAIVLHKPKICLNHKTPCQVRTNMCRSVPCTNMSACHHSLKHNKKRFVFCISIFKITSIQPTLKNTSCRMFAGQMFPSFLRIRTTFVVYIVHQRIVENYQK